MARGQQRFVPVTALEELILLACMNLGEHAHQKEIELLLSEAVGRGMDRSALDTVIRRMAERGLLEYTLATDGCCYGKPTYVVTEAGFAAQDRAAEIRGFLMTG